MINVIQDLQPIQVQGTVRSADGEDCGFGELLAAVTAAAGMPAAVDQPEVSAGTDQQRRLVEDLVDPEWMVLAAIESIPMVASDLEVAPADSHGAGAVTMAVDAQIPVSTGDSAVTVAVDGQVPVSTGDSEDSDVPGAPIEIKVPGSRPDVPPGRADADRGPVVIPGTGRVDREPGVVPGIGLRDRADAGSSDREPMALVNRVAPLPGMADAVRAPGREAGGNPIRTVAVDGKVSVPARSWDESALPARPHVPGGEPGEGQQRAERGLATAVRASGGRVELGFGFAGELEETTAHAGAEPGQAVENGQAVPEGVNVIPVTPEAEVNDVRAESTVSEPVTMDRLPEKMVELARTVDRNDGRVECELRLNPPELGRITVRISAREGRLAAEIAVPGPEVLNLVDGQLSRLRHDLTAAGYQVDSLEAVLDERTNEQSGRQSGQFDGDIESDAETAGGPDEQVSRYQWLHPDSSFEFVA